MSMTLAELTNLVQYLVGDPQMSTYSQAMYSESIEFAIKQYAIKTGVTYQEASALVGSTGLVTLPSDYLRINRIMLGTKQLIESTMGFEGDKSETWTANTSAAHKRWVVWSGAAAKLLPLMTTYSAVTATIGYVQQPATLAGTYTVDSRIPTKHNEYLKYAAAFYLLHLDGDGQDIQKGDKFMETFNGLIGYEDPVLQYSQNLTRKMGKREA
jgi:hypothetical protein